MDLFDIAVAKALAGGGGGGGGGGASWELLASEEYSFSEEAPSTATEIDQIIVPYEDVYNSDVIIVGVARRKYNSKTASAHIGTDCWFVNPNQKNGNSDTLTGTTNRGIWNYYFNSSQGYAVVIAGTNSSGGLYIDTITRYGDVCHLSIKRRYISSYGSQIGDYDFKVYALSWPDGFNPYKL